MSRGRRGVPPHQYVRRDGEQAGPDRRAICRDCGMVGRPGDARHPTDAPPLAVVRAQQVSPAVAAAGRARDAQLLGERYDSSVDERYDVTTVAREQGARPRRRRTARAATTTAEQDQHRQDPAAARARGVLPRVVLDWSRHKTGPPKPCRYDCGETAIMRDEAGQPCHKTCAERHIAERAARLAAQQPTAAQPPTDLLTEGPTP